MVCQFWLPLACAVHVAPGATAASAKLGASFTAVTVSVTVDEAVAAKASVESTDRVSAPLKFSAP